LVATEFFYPKTVVWSSGVHVVVVEVDRNTGKVHFLKYVVVHDCGIPLNLMVHHLVFPSSNNPLGVKSVGESGPISPPAAIASAIEDALDGAFKITRLPITAGTIIAACRTNSEA
jgi:carbon-monoxide dehydrogenase large subunit